MLTHDEAVARVIRARARVTLGQVAGGFVASLTSAPPRYRTGLVSFALAALQGSPWVMSWCCGSRPVSGKAWS